MSHKGGGGYKQQQHAAPSPFEDEDLIAEHMDDIALDTELGAGHEDSLDFGADDYALPQPKKAGKKKKKGSAAASSSASRYMGGGNAEMMPMAQPSVNRAPPPFVPAVPLPPVASNTAFNLPPGSDAEIQQPQRKNYLNNVTNYFNEKKKQYYPGGSSSSDPELSGAIDAMNPNDPAAIALRKREAELLAREQALQSREAQVRAIEAKLPNWPIKAYPLVYHNIAEDILPENRRFMQLMYALWLFELVCLAMNLLAGVVDVFSGTTCAYSIISVIENLVFFCAGAMGSWFLWYKVIYDSCKKQQISSVSYSRFSCGFLCHVGWTTLMLTGLWASDGVLSILTCISSSATSTAFMVIGTIFWGINFLISGYVSKQVYSRYKAAGGTFSSMKADLTKQAAKAAIMSRV